MRRNLSAGLRLSEIGNSVSVISVADRVQETPIHKMGDLLVGIDVLWTCLAVAVLKICEKSGGRSGHGLTGVVSNAKCFEYTDAVPGVQSIEDTQSIVALVSENCILAIWFRNKLKRRARTVFVARRKKVYRVTPITASHGDCLLEIFDIDDVPTALSPLENIISSSTVNKSKQGVFKPADVNKVVTSEAINGDPIGTQIRGRRRGRL